MRQFAAESNPSIRQSDNPSTFAFLYNLHMSEKKKVRLTETVKAAG
jgi:hypothetical protein